MQMFKAVLARAGMAAVAAAQIEFPSMIGRSLLEMTFEELPFPRGDVQHQVATSSSAVVDGAAYAIKCAPLDTPPPTWAQCIDVYCCELVSGSLHPTAVLFCQTRPVGRAEGGHASISCCDGSAEAAERPFNLEVYAGTHQLFAVATRWGTTSSGGLRTGTVRASC